MFAVTIICSMSCSASPETRGMMVDTNAVFIKNEFRFAAVQLHGAAGCGSSPSKYRQAPFADIKDP